MEGVTLLPIVIPPVVMAAGLENLQGSAPQWVVSLWFNHPLTALTPVYVVLAMPFTYRAIDNGVRAIDLRTLVDASRNLGGSWFQTLVRVILPERRERLDRRHVPDGGAVPRRGRDRNLHALDDLPGRAGALDLQSQVGVAVALSMTTLAFTFLLLFLLSFVARRRRGATLVRVI